MLWRELTERLDDVMGQAEERYAAGDVVLGDSQVAKELCRLLLDLTESDLRPLQGPGRLGDQEVGRR